MLAIAKEYLEKATEVKKLLLRGLNLKSIDELFRLRGKMPRGEFYIDHCKCEFVFHGIGVRFSKRNYNAELFGQTIPKELNIDLDYGRDFNAIEPSKLERYIEEYYPEYKEFDYKKIKQEFAEEIKAGNMYKDDCLYYFKEPDEIMTPYYKKLLEIKERPGMYLGYPSLTRLSAFMHGFEICFYDLKKKWIKGWCDGFQEWIQEKYAITSSHHWSEIILFHSSSEEEAFYKFYDLLEEYKKLYLAKKKED